MGAHSSRAQPADGLVEVPAGAFDMGSRWPGAHPADGEQPVHRVELPAFLIDPHAVSNERFAAFVAASGHITDAERWGCSFVFQGLLSELALDAPAVAAAPWWRQVQGACWSAPEGPGSDLHGRSDHPVVHVSHNDALAYCAWAGLRLPTEAEWERAARGGLEGCVFPWGDELQPGGRHMMNVWQGDFPDHNSCEDGFAGTAPVGSFPANGYGLHNMTGNVWEWTADWFDPDWYRRSPAGSPSGPTVGRRRVTRGGSYLCHASYCTRYRVSARASNLPDDSTGNIGFRVVAGLPAAS